MKALLFVVVCCLPVIDRNRPYVLAQVVRLGCSSQCQGSVGIDLAAVTGYQNCDIAAAVPDS